MLLSVDNTENSDKRELGSLDKQVRKGIPLKTSEDRGEKTTGLRGEAGHPELQRLILSKNFKSKGD